MNPAEVQFAQKVVDQLEESSGEDMVQAQASELISIIVELLLPILQKWLEGCGEDSSAAIRRAKTPRLQSIMLNVKMRREVGRKDWKKLGGRDMAKALLKVAADDANTELVRSIMGER